MTPWTRTPEVEALLRSCADRPPASRIFAFRFQETEARYVGRRVRQLRRLHRAAEPPLDSPEWRAWLALDPQRAIALALAAKLTSA